jgi:hypothetical protein
LEFLIGFFADIPFAVLGAESVFVKLALAATYGFGGFFFAKKARSAFVKTAAVFVGGVCIALGLSFALSFCGMRMTAVDSQSQCTLVCAKGKNYAVGVGGAELGTLMQNRNIGKVDLLVIPCVLEKDVSCAEELCGCILFLLAHIRSNPRSVSITKSAKKVKVNEKSMGVF